MNFSFLEAVKGVFTNDLVSKAAGYLGETESQIKKGLEAVIPVSLAGIINKAQSAPESLYSFAKEAFNSGITNKIGDSFRSGGGGVPSLGPSLITGVLGEKFGSIANSVSDFTGLKGSSVSSLFGAVVPLALGLLGKHVTENNSSPGSLATMLGSQKNSITSMIPSGLSLTGILPGLKSVVNMVTQVEPKRKVSWMVPILLSVVALLLVWWLFKKPNRTASESVKVENPIPEAKVEAPPVMAKEPLKVKLPNGVELEAYKGGIEDMLIAFINNPSAQPGKENWFDFNDLNFKSGGAEIVPESRNELDNIVKILQAYPKVKIKIGGYTDKVGDEAANKKLSADRAMAVADALKAAGVGGQVMGAEGYGSDFAKYPADASEEQRIKDRRVSVSVREK